MMKRNYLICGFIFAVSILFLPSFVSSSECIASSPAGDYDLGTLIDADGDQRFDIADNYLFYYENDLGGIIYSVELNATNPTPQTYAVNVGTDVNDLVCFTLYGEPDFHLILLARDSGLYCLTTEYTWNQILAVGIEEIDAVYTEERGLECAYITANDEICYFEEGESPIIIESNFYIDNDFSDDKHICIDSDSLDTRVLYYNSSLLYIYDVDTSSEKLNKHMVSSKITTATLDMNRNYLLINYDNGLDDDPGYLWKIDMDTLDSKLVRSQTEYCISIDPTRNFIYSADFGYWSFDCWIHSNTYYYTNENPIGFHSWISKVECQPTKMRVAKWLNDVDPIAVYYTPSEGLFMLPALDTEHPEKPEFTTSNHTVSTIDSITINWADCDDFNDVHYRVELSTSVDFNSIYARYHTDDSEQYIGNLQEQDYYVRVIVNDTIDPEVPLIENVSDVLHFSYDDPINNPAPEDPNDDPTIPGFTGILILSAASIVYILKKRTNKVIEK